MEQFGASQLFVGPSTSPGLDALSRGLTPLGDGRRTVESEALNLTPERGGDAGRDQRPVRNEIPATPITKRVAVVDREVHG